MAAQLLYYGLTTGAGVQTLGEEYCDILQVTGMPQLKSCMQGLVIHRSCRRFFIVDLLSLSCHKPGRC